MIKKAFCILTACAAVLFLDSCFGNLLETVHDNLDPIIWVKRIDAPSATDDKDFGRTTAAAGDMVAIGDPSFGTETNNEGYCFVYQCASGEIEPAAELHSNPSNSNDGFFSRAISFNGNYLMIGDYLDYSGSSQHYAIHNRNAPTQNGWARVQYTGGTPGFADAVAILDGFAAAGEPGGSVSGMIGRIHVYTYALEDVESWTPTAAPFVYGALQDCFGASLFGSGSKLLVGAPGESGTPTIAGYAVIAQLSALADDGVSSTVAITAPNLSIGDRFGTSVGLSGDAAIVGAPNHSGRGAAFMFSKDLGGIDNWGLEQALEVSTGASGDLFGESVAISGDITAVGAPRASVDSIRTGCVYLYVRSGTAWVMVKRILPDEGSNDMMFGAAVSLSGNLLVVGAPGYKVNSVPRGCAFVYGIR